MKSGRIFRILFLFSISLLLLSTCKKDTGENKVTKIVKAKLSGYVQKGPYINGTSIQMYELDASLNQTGKNFSTQISDNKGSFEINNVALSSQYVEFLANGYYFNEIMGNISLSQLSLYALSDITDLSTVNVNILTHLEKSRVEYLGGKGMTFTAAKDTAQKEVLAIFGFQANNMDRSEELDISVDKQENAILLAISLILQGNRSVGDLTELLANISTDIQQDGKLDDKSILTNLKNSTLGLDLAGIRSNLQKRYEDLGYSTIIPDFETFINIFLADAVSKPTATTMVAANISSSGATLRGTINANNLTTAITFEYGTTSNYGTTINSAQTPIAGHNIQSVSADISGLTSGTTYYVRVHAVNSAGATYGNEIIFTTPDKGTVDDIDGNVYKTIMVGNQIWMAENLKVTKFNDGTEIPNITDGCEWYSSMTPEYCWYNNDTSTRDVFGGLYNWHTVNPSSNGNKNVCPAGWHVPTDQEWNTLELYLIDNGFGYGGSGKEIAKTLAVTSGWRTSDAVDSPGNDQSTNNLTGFSAVATGGRNANNSNCLGFWYIGETTRWWCRPENNDGTNWAREVSWFTGDFIRYYPDKQFGQSIRCVKD